MTRHYATETEISAMYAASGMSTADITTASILKAMEDAKNMLIPETLLPSVYVTTDEIMGRIRQHVKDEYPDPFTRYYKKLWEHNACTAYGIPIESYPTRDEAIARARLLAGKGKRVELITQ